MFKKIATTTVFAGVALAAVAALPTSDANAWGFYHHGYGYGGGWPYFGAPQIYVAPPACQPGYWMNGYFVPGNC